MKGEKVKRTNASDDAPKPLIVVLAKYPSKGSKTRLHPLVPPPSPLPLALLKSTLASVDAVEGKARKVCVVAGEEGSDRRLVNLLNEDEGNESEGKGSNTGLCCGGVEPWDFARVERGTDLTTALQSTLDYCRSAYGGVGIMIVGMDCPHMHQSVYERCLLSIERGVNHLVPSRDGGYVALGLTGDTDGSVFEGVAWSSRCTGMDQLRRILELKGEVTVGETNFDIDDVQDLLRLGCMIEEGKVQRLGCLEDIMRDKGLVMTRDDAAAWISRWEKATTTGTKDADEDKPNEKSAWFREGVIFVAGAACGLFFGLKGYRAMLWRKS